MTSLAPPPPWVRTGACEACGDIRALILLAYGPRAGVRLCLSCAPPVRKEG